MTWPDIFADVRGSKRSLSLRVRRRILLCTSPVASSWMALRTRVGRKALIGTGEAPVVSMTTHGARIETVHRTIESIGRGSLRPSRIVLWLDDPELYENVPGPLKLLQRRGLEIRLTRNYGPHTKYYPLVLEDSHSVSSFATADDDIIYPRWWLRRLAEAADRAPSEVVCHRAHRIVVRDGRVAPYSHWPSVQRTEAHPTVFATGVSGVLYPPEMRAVITEAGDRFLVDCPRSDDIWLNRLEIDSRIPVRQVADESKHFWITPGSQRTALMAGNLSGGNDAVAAALYGAAQIAELER